MTKCTTKHHSFCIVCTKRHKIINLLLQPVKTCDIVLSVKRHKHELTAWQRNYKPKHLKNLDNFITRQKAYRTTWNDSLTPVESREENPDRNWRNLTLKWYFRERQLLCTTCYKVLAPVNVLVYAPHIPFDSLIICQNIKRIQSMFINIPEII